MAAVVWLVSDAVVGGLLEDGSYNTLCINIVIYENGHNTDIYEYVSISVPCQVIFLMDNSTTNHDKVK